MYDTPYFFKMLSKTFIVILLSFHVAITKAAAREILDDAQLDFIGLANKYGLQCEEYDFTTEDGYILKMFHIPGNKTKPVLMMHGLMDTTDTLILRGHKSVAYLMAMEGYDFWASNYRGNRYSRRHVSLNPDTDEAFWAFSMHEHGVYDVAASIDFVLNKTGRSQLALGGYSEGSVLMLTLGSERPEYNDKVSVFLSMTPIYSLHHLGIPSYLMSAYLLRMVLEGFHVHELVNYDSPIVALARNICTRIPKFCIGMVVGFNNTDDDNIDPEYMRVLASHYPAGTSAQNMHHYLQMMMTGRFAKYDYGPEMNLVKYKSRIPPLYDLSKVTTRMALFLAGKDYFTTKYVVQLLKKNLPNVVFAKVFKTFDHITLNQSVHFAELVYPYMSMILKKYT